MHDKYTDPLSRRTWSLALLATAGTDIVISHLGRIDACLTSLTDEEFLATAASSSRLGVMQRHRRLQARIWNASAGLSPRTRLLIAHFTARLSAHDPLLPLHDAELEALASPDAAAWPIARAVTTRLLTEPSPALLRALEALGPATAVDLPRTESTPGAAAADAVPDAVLRSRDTRCASTLPRLMDRGSRAGSFASQRRSQHGTRSTCRGMGPESSPAVKTGTEAGRPCRRQRGISYSLSPVTMPSSNFMRRYGPPGPSDQGNVTAFGRRVPSQHHNHVRRSRGRDGFRRGGSFVPACMA